MSSSTEVWLFSVVDTTSESVMPDPIITVIGSLNIDLINRVSRIPAAGETLITQSFDTGQGGKGANQAVACARLSRKKGSEYGSVKVRMDGAVGDEAFGEELINGLKSNYVDALEVARIGRQKTGIAIVIVTSARGRIEF